MLSQRQELTRATRDLVLPRAQFRILPDEEAAPIIGRIERHFVERPGLRWWWEAFRGTPIAQAHFAGGAGWKHLTRIAPPRSGLVWFVVEEGPTFVLCEGNVDAIQSVIGECWGFEYYLVSQGLDWLVCENHSDVVCAVGEAVANRLIQEAERHGLNP